MISYSLAWDWHLNVQFRTFFKRRTAIDHWRRTNYLYFRCLRVSSLSCCLTIWRRLRSRAIVTTQDFTSRMSIGDLANPIWTWISTNFFCLLRFSKKSQEVWFLKNATHVKLNGTPIVIGTKHVFLWARNMSYKIQHMINSAVLKWFKEANWR